MSNLLKIDAWYKALGLVGAVVFVAALTVPLQVPNAPVALMGLGGALFGIGEWINHPLQTRLVPSPVGWLKAEGYLRKATLMGTTIDLAGLLLIGWGALKLAELA